MDRVRGLPEVSQLRGRAGAPAKLVFLAPPHGAAGWVGWCLAKATAEVAPASAPVRRPAVVTAPLSRLERPCPLGSALAEHLSIFLLSRGSPRPPPQCPVRAQCQALCWPPRPLV